ncbi:MAG: transcriptional repressor [Barnesiella sp.]|nr:transcriptional repressor [Barnesiella sp.]
MSSSIAEEFLLRKGVKPTSNRILVMRELINATRPVSLADLEASLDSLDKTSIFRVLELFAENDIVHVMEDGSRSNKYELCHSDSHHSIDDQHVHFFCEKCMQTFCLDNIAVPSIDIPAGFAPHSVNYMLKGLCPDCSSKQ